MSDTKFRPMVEGSMFPALADDVPLPKGTITYAQKAAADRKAAAKAVKTAGRSKHRHADLLNGEVQQVSAEVRSHLVAEAKRLTGIASTAKLLEYALARLVLDDDFGAKLVALKGTIPSDFELEL